MNRRWLPILLVVTLAAVMLGMPTLLRAIPSRYVARLPEPLQQLGAPRDQGPTLPTVAMSVEASTLLGSLSFDATATIASEVKATAAQPATPTAMPIAEGGADDQLPPSPSATALPSPSPVPPSATPFPSPIPPPKTARLEGFGHIFQTWNNCGPATLAMALSYFGMTLSQNETASVLKPNPEDRNVSPEEMVAYVNVQTPFEALARVNGNLDTVRRLVSQGIPVILEIGIDPPGEFRWLGWYGHYLLVVAYDNDLAQFWVYDSWFGTSEEPLENSHRSGRILTYAQANEYWPHFNRSYIALFRPEEAALVADTIGPSMDDDTMWHMALTTARADAATDSENAFFWFNLGSVYNALGQYEQAAIAFDQARSIGLPWRMLWYQFGPYNAYYHVGRYEDVILLADVTLKDRPYFEEAFYYRGLARKALGNLSDAQDDFRRAADFNPNFTLAVNALAEING